MRIITKLTNFLYDIENSISDMEIETVPDILEFLTCFYSGIQLISSPFQILQHVQIEHHYFLSVIWFIVFFDLLPRVGC